MEWTRSTRRTTQPLSLFQLVRLQVLSTPNGCRFCGFALMTHYFRRHDFRVLTITWFEIIVSFFCFHYYIYDFLQGLLIIQGDMHGMNQTGCDAVTLSPRCLDQSAGVLYTFR